MAYELPRTLDVCNVSIAVVETEIVEDDGSTMQVGEYDGVAKEMRIDPRLRDDTCEPPVWAGGSSSARSYGDKRL